MSLSNIEQTNLTDVIDSHCDRSWDCFGNWIHCICVVTFDLELGQALEVNNFICDKCTSQLSP